MDAECEGKRILVGIHAGQIRELPSITMFATLACISNPVGGDWIGNARWTGVPLASLLDAAGVGKSTRDVVFLPADGYSDSIPIERAHAAALLSGL
jgi:DMSO/TMAO reductase YedYZ molybdopterin-dependent catalytic subunit